MNGIDDSLFLLAVAVATSVLLAALARRRGLQPGGWRPALQRTLEWVGLTVVCYLLNVGCAFGIALIARAVGGAFISSYLAADASLLVIAALQASALSWWGAEEATRPR